VRTFEVQFGCIRIGAIFTPLNWRLGPRELAEIIDDCQPVLIIHDDVYLPQSARNPTSMGRSRKATATCDSTPGPREEEPGQPHRCPSDQLLLD
jgi:fatty-acyl-CoA synthase